MKKVLRYMIFVFAFLFFFGITATPEETSAATGYVMSRCGDAKKCGKYKIKYTSSGLYTKKGSGNWKRIDHPSKKQQECGFTSDGTYIYYAVNKGNSHKIYRIKVNGTGKKLIRDCKHVINVDYYYDGKVIFESDVDDFGYIMFGWTYSYTISSKKTKRIQEYSYPVQAKGKYITLCEAVGLAGCYDPLDTFSYNISEGKLYKTKNCQGVPWIIGDRIYVAQYTNYEGDSSLKKIYTYDMKFGDAKAKSKVFKANIIEKITSKYVNYVKNGKHYHYTYSTGKIKRL